jgi:hypothetical protein
MRHAEEGTSRHHFRPDGSIDSALVPTDRVHPPGLRLVLTVSFMTKPGVDAISEGGRPGW